MEVFSSSSEKFNNSIPVIFRCFPNFYDKNGDFFNWNETLVKQEISAPAEDKLEFSGLTPELRIDNWELRIVVFPSEMILKSRFSDTLIINYPLSIINYQLLEFETRICVFQIPIYLPDSRELLRMTRLGST